MPWQRPQPKSCEQTAHIHSIFSSIAFGPSLCISWHKTTGIASTSVDMVKNLATKENPPHNDQNDLRIREDHWFWDGFAAGSQFFFGRSEVET